jgi:hypothetical protein
MDEESKDVRWLFGNFEENKIAEVTTYTKGNRMISVLKRYKHVTWYCDIHEAREPRLRYRRPREHIVIEDQEDEWKLVWPGKMPAPIAVIVEAEGADIQEMTELTRLAEANTLEKHGWMLKTKETSILENGNLVPVGGFNESGEYAGIKMKGPPGTTRKV